MSTIVKQAATKYGIDEEEINEMISKLHDAGYRNAAGLKAVDEDEEWEEYGVPTSVQKAIRKVLNGNSKVSAKASTRSNSPGSGKGNGKTVYKIATNEGTINSVQGSDATINNGTTHSYAPQS